MAFTYLYTKANVNVAMLTDEVAAGGFIPNLLGVVDVATSIRVHFDGALSGAEQATLAAIVAAHDGLSAPPDPTPEEEIQEVPVGGDASGTVGNIVVANDSHSHTLSTVTDAGTAASYDVASSGDAGAGEVVKGNDTRLSDARTPVAHTHSKTDVTDLNPIEVGTAAGGDLAGTYPNPSVNNDSHNHTLSTVTDAGTAASRNVAVSGNASPTEVVKGDDTRLSDARTPVAHTHTESDITDLQDYVVNGDSAGGDLSGTYPNPSVVNDSHNHTLSTVTDAGTAASRNVPLSGDAASTEVVLGNDSRLTNSRTPTGAAGGALTGTYPSPTMASSIYLPGSPTTTTQSTSDDSNKIATTAFVQDIADQIVSGDGYHYSEDNTTSSTTNNATNPVTHQTLTTGTVSAGTYVVFWQITWRITNNNAVFNASLRYDPTSANTLMDEVIGKPSSNNVADRYVSSGFDQIALTSGTHSFAIKFYRASGAGSAVIERSRIMLWRVS